MDDELLSKLGKRAFIQSLHSYKGGEMEGVVVFGLDTEFVPHVDKASELISWQLAGETESLLTTKRLNIKNLYIEAKKMLHGKRARVYVFVCFFSLAEIQFFDLTEWVLSEFKGKYRLSQNYGDGRLLIVDLADWYQHTGLKAVAELWGLKKEEEGLEGIVTDWGLKDEDNNSPIGKIVESIERKEHTKGELLKDSRFKNYAIKDAVLDQRIYSQMREYFFGFGVDIVKTMTPANTSASMFRMTLGKVIEQRDTVLRTMALRCCWGGRMECLFRGEKDLVYEYDATGHHPSSTIALGLLPVEKDWKRTSNLNRWLTGISGVGKVYFKFPDNELFPCLPIMMNDALVYVREGVSFCTVTEARLARKLGAKLILYSGYYYTTGTDVLKVYLQKIQDIRNQSEDPAQRVLLKLLSNSVIGKLFQKRVGLDLGKVQKYADEQGIPYEEAIKVKGVDFGEGEATVGSCFYPEWYALILGYARTSISVVARQHNALIISSDSFVTEEKLEEHFDFAGITFNQKEVGDLVSYRTRFYRVGTKLAHHAVHSLAASERVLAEFLNKPSYGYQSARFRHLKESWKTKKAFGSRIFRPMKVSLGFDFKRQLLEDGTTKPWNDVHDRAVFLGQKEEN